MSATSFPTSPGRAASRYSMVSKRHLNDKAQARRDKELLKLLDQGLLDTAEQEELVQALHREGERQAATWQTAYGCVACLVAIFFAYAAVKELLDPWSTKYTAEFRNLWSSWHVSLWLVMSSVACGVTGAAMLRAQEPTFIPATAARLANAAALGGLPCSVFWGASLWIEHRRVAAQATLPRMFPWDLLWLPAAPLTTSLLGKHMLDSAQSINSQVSDLATKMYHYKKV